MMLYASSCERPSKSSARVFLPSSVSNSYSFSTGTQGRSRCFCLISSFRSACSPSSLASSSRASCHSSRVPILRSGISSPSSPTKRSREPTSSDRTLPALTAARTHEPPGFDRALALHLDEPQWLGGEVVAQELPGRASDLDRVGGPMGLHPARHVHGIAPEVVEEAAAPDHAGHHQTRADAHAEAQGVLSAFGKA